jgi:hypothetical protein
MITNIEKEQFQKINFDDIEVGKIYCHSKEFIEVWKEICHKWIGFDSFRYHLNKSETVLNPYNFNFNNKFMLLAKEKEFSGKAKDFVAVKYTILFDGKVMYRFFQFDHESRELATYPILNLIS